MKSMLFNPNTEKQMADSLIFHHIHIQTQYKQASHSSPFNLSSSLSHLITRATQTGTKQPLTTDKLMFSVQNHSTCREFGYFLQSN